MPKVDPYELLQELDAFCFTYENADSLYTLFKYQINGNCDAKSGQVFDNMQKAVYFNQRNRGVGKMHSIRKKRFLTKKYDLVSLKSFRKTNHRRLLDQFLQRKFN